MKVTYENVPCVNCYECEDTHVEGKCLFGTTRYKRIANHRMHVFVMKCRRAFENNHKQQAAMLRVVPKHLAIHRAHCVFHEPGHDGFVQGGSCFYQWDADGKETPTAIVRWTKVSEMAQQALRR